MYNIFNASSFCNALIVLLIFEKVCSTQLKDFIKAIKPYADRQIYPPKTTYKHILVILIPNIAEDNLKINKVLDVNDLDKIYHIVLNGDFTEVQRRFTDIKKARETLEKARLLKSQQEGKIKEINDFMADHYLTTNYLYEELQRIKRQRTVRDDLRNMVAYLERPEKKKIKEQIMKCYREARKTQRIPADEWRHDTNNLVVNVIRDPYNYGYIN